MKWSNNKKILIHNKEYFVCLDIENETYSLQYYFNHDDGDIIFKGEGFYFFDSNNDIFKYSRTQPVYWLDIIRPTFE
jgi:hypothetical protein